MRLEQSDDVLLIETIVNTPEIAHFVLEDNDLIFQYSPNAIYLIVRDDHEFVAGVFILKRLFRNTVEIHTCLFRAFNGKREAAFLIYGWLIDNGINTLTTMVPNTYRHVKAFCQSVGMHKSGEIPAAFEKSGTLQTCTMYAITQDEMKEVLRCQPPQ